MLIHPEFKQTAMFTPRFSLYLSLQQMVGCVLGRSFQLCLVHHVTMKMLPHLLVLQLAVYGIIDVDCVIIIPASTAVGVVAGGG